MKHLATILCVGIFGFANAQSTSRDIEMYERYENGELVEQRQSATENGIPIENFDFEKAKREMRLKSAEFNAKSDELMRKAEESMDERMKEMERKMADFEKRSEEMHRQMEQRMKEGFDSAEPSERKIKKTPAPIENPTMGESTKDVKFT